MFKKLFTLLIVLIWCTSLIAQDLATDSGKLPGQISPYDGTAALLWDNYLTPSTTAIVSGEWLGLPAGANTVACADDFIIPAGETWDITEVLAPGFYSAGLADNWLIEFWTDAPGSPGTLIESRYVTASGDTVMGTFPTVTLSEGTYWVSVMGSNNTASTLAEFRWNWYSSEDPGVGLEPHLNDLAGFFGGTAGWVTFTSLGIGQYANLMFQIYGELGGGAIDKLLLTEFVVTPTAAEFIEIYNPNASPVDLTNYFLSDVAFDGGPEYYYHIVLGTYEGGFGDFMAKFPNAATIGAGEHQIVALNGDADFLSTYGVNPTYEIDQAEFQSGPPDAIPDMMETHPGSIYGADSTHNPGLTNGDEMIMLFSWDGMSDLVGDVDYVLYNSASPVPNNEAVDKTGVTIDGPDPGTTGSTYLNDTPVANQLSALSPTSGFSAQREDYTEGLQVMAGGNGVTGSDETSEDMNNTWIVDIPSPFAPVPVELTSFTASVNENNVTLNWTTATETNNLGFEIQRNSENDFQAVGFVNGNGTTTETQEYSFTDVVTTGSYTYRLKQVDYDGSFNYSEAIEVEIVVPDVFALEQNYPNPFNPSTKIDFSLAVDSKVSLKVFDILGQEVANLVNTNLVAGSHNVDFNASLLNSGVYFYRIEATGIDGTNFTNVKKMILTK